MNPETEVCRSMALFMGYAETAEPGQSTLDAVRQVQADKEGRVYISDPYQIKGAGVWWHEWRRFNPQQDMAQAAQLFERAARRTQERISTEAIDKGNGEWLVVVEGEGCQGYGLTWATAVCDFVLARWPELRRETEPEKKP